MGLSTAGSVPTAVPTGPGHISGGDIDRENIPCITVAEFGQVKVRPELSVGN